MFNKRALCKHQTCAYVGRSAGGDVDGWQEADGLARWRRRRLRLAAGFAPVNAPAPNPGDGNRMVFKPSPLQGLKKTAPAARAPEPAAAGPAEVTAVPLATPPPTERAHEDLTYFSPTIPDAAPSPESAQPAAAAPAAKTAPADRTGQPAAKASGRGGALLVIFGLGALAIVALAAMLVLT